MFRKRRDTTAAPGKASHATGKAAHAPPRTRQAPRHNARPAASRGTTHAAGAAAPAAGPVLLHEHSGGITLLTLDRPETRNSLSAAMLSALGEALMAIAKDASVRAVVIAANGPVFCAGHDLKELTAHRGDADGGRDFYEQVMARCCAVMQAIVHLPQPVIACVGGTATAAGCQMVASCDLAIASDQA